MERFVEEIISKLNGVLMGDFSLVPVNAQKNNDITLLGIRFDKKGEKVSPIVYVEKYYEEYIEGIITMEMIVESIVKLISEKRDVEDVVRKLQQYNLIQYDLVFNLINYDLNREILEERPHKKFMDLAAVGMIRVETRDGLDGIVYVTHNMLKTWKIDEDTLFEQCMRNTLHRENHSILDIKDIVAKMSVCAENEIFQEMMDDMFGDDKSFMYVLSNEKRHMGANALVNHTLLHNFAMEHDSNLIIYPSSIHELIIVFEEDFRFGCMDPDMVKQINEEQVYREEWLSNSVYMYDREKEKLFIYQQGEPLCNNLETERMAS